MDDSVTSNYSLSSVSFLFNPTTEKVCSVSVLECDTLNTSYATFLSLGNPGVPLEWLTEPRCAQMQSILWHYPFLLVWTMASLRITPGMSLPPSSGTLFVIWLVVLSRLIIWKEMNLNTNISTRAMYLCYRSKVTQ